MGDAIFLKMPAVEIEAHHALEIDVLVKRVVAQHLSAKRWETLLSEVLLRPSIVQISSHALDGFSHLIGSIDHVVRCPRAFDSY